MTKNKNLFKNISLFLCLVPMLLLSLFVAFPKNNKMIVSADYSEPNYTFNGSNTINVATAYNSSGPQVWGLLNIKFNIARVDSGINIVASGVGQYRTSTYGFSGFYSFNQSFTRTVSGYEGKAIYIGDGSAWFSLGVNSENTDFNCNVTHVQYFSVFENPGVSMTTCIRYFDTNNNWLQFSFSCYGSSLYNEFSQFALSDRTYYFAPDFSDNTIYNEGYNSGYNSGYSDGNSTGYNDGYNAGETVGYGNGYNDGLEQSDNYSFLSLIGAVVDAPVTAFTSLLNFNLLGFNMLGFVTGLLTLGLIIFIVKLILGGK